LPSLEIIINIVVSVSKASKPIDVRTRLCPIKGKDLERRSTKRILIEKRTLQRQLCPSDFVTTRIFCELLEGKRKGKGVGKKEEGRGEGRKEKKEEKGQRDRTRPPFANVWIRHCIDTSTCCTGRRNAVDK
jgi:hypothetical protein